MEKKTKLMVEMMAKFKEIVTERKKAEGEGGGHRKQLEGYVVFVNNELSVRERDVCVPHTSVIYFGQYPGFSNSSPSSSTPNSGGWQTKASATSRITAAASGCIGISLKGCSSCMLISSSPNVT